MNGFVATTVLMSMGCAALALVLTVSAAAVAYEESVQKEISRVQSALDAVACSDSVKLIEAKDAFASGPIDLPEFNCHVHL